MLNTVNNVKNVIHAPTEAVINVDKLLFVELQMKTQEHLQRKEKIK